MERFKDFALDVFVRVVILAGVLVLLPVALDSAMQYQRVSEQCWSGPAPTCVSSKGVAGGVTLEWLVTFQPTKKAS